MQDTSSFAIAPEILANLREQLRTRLSLQEKNTILGSQLMPLINSILGPQTTYQKMFPAAEKPQLRKFVEQFLGGLIEPTDQRKGTDFIYNILAASVTRASLKPGQLWKSFVAINPSHKIVFDRKSDEISIIARKTTPTSEVTEIDSVQFDEHKQLCVKFAKNNSSNDALARVARDYRPDSYPEWLRVLREQTPSLNDEWTQFRQAELVRIFRQRLIKAGASPEHTARLVNELDIARKQAVPPHKENNLVAASHPLAANSTAFNEKTLRDILLLALEKLDYQQLRALQFPVGTILDALADHQKR